jgi:hypothetical protein
MRKTSYAILFAAAAGLGCSSPARVEVRPDPLVLVGEGAKGQLEAVIFDEDGKQLTEGLTVTWMCLDGKTVKVQQDGLAIAQSSGKTLVDVEIVGTEIHGAGTIEVKIPAWVETSHEEIGMVLGQGDARVWGEVRDDKGFPLQGYLPEWKVDDPKVVSIQAMQDTEQTRTTVKITPLAAGETFVTASYKDFAKDIRVVVVTPEEAAAAEAAAAEAASGAAQ